MSKRKQQADDSFPNANEEGEAGATATGKKDKKRMKKARKADIEEATAQSIVKKHKKRKISKGNEELAKTADSLKSDYTDSGPKLPIAEGIANENQDASKAHKKKKKKAKKDTGKDEANKMHAEGKKKKKKKKAKIEADKELSNDVAARVKESAPEEATSSGAPDAGWNNWEASSFEDEQRKNKFLRLMGAKKAGDNQQQPKKGLFGSLKPSGPTAIDTTTGTKITEDLASQFEDALQRRNFRGGLGLGSDAKKSEGSAAPHPHPYPGKNAAKLHIDTHPKSIKFDD